MVALASDVYEARLQVGRVLSGRALAAASFLRGLIVSVLTVGTTEGGTVAPAWVVVSRREDGFKVARISAGREPGAGELILASVRASLGELGAEAFLHHWSPSEEGRRHAQRGNRPTVSFGGWRKSHDDDWLDCQSPAWQQGYADGYAGREADQTRDGRHDRRLSPTQRNYRDGFSTGQCERQIDE